MLHALTPLQLDYIRLWFLVQHSLTSFYKIQQHFPSLQHALDPKHYETWQMLGIHKNHLQRFRDFQQDASQQQFEKCLAQIQKDSDFVITQCDPAYPQQLQHYQDKPPLLFGQGNIQALIQPQVAIVGSRKPSPHGRQVAYDFAYYLSEQGFYICSGLAQGIDEAAHRAALQHHFPRRNRIVSGLSLGVIVAEATLKSGSLITAKLAAEQGKTIFAIPGHIYSEHHQGCHQLIREGAILIDHPQQVIEDLALATQWQAEAVNDTYEMNNIDQALSSTTQHIPDDLISVYLQLDWVGQDLDQLSIHLNMDAATLTGKLMELELLGHAIQQSGHYLRCRMGKLGSQ